MAQFDKNDPYMVFNTDTGNDVETKPTLGSAESAADYLNTRCKSGKYVVIERSTGEQLWPKPNVTQSET